MYYYLKTNNEAELWTALEAASLAKQEEDEWVFTGTALDIIGTIYKPTGNVVTDEDGNESPEMAALEGYHANLIADEGIEGLPTIPAPNNPYRVWAGDK